jgi:hypothetical protein
VYDGQKARLTDAELHAFFDGLFPHGFAGGDVLADIAPEGRDQSPLLACFHTSLEQRYEEPYSGTGTSRRVEPGDETGRA